METVATILYARVSTSRRISFLTDQPSFSNDTALGVEKLCKRGVGWLQAYGAALNEAQWQNDVRRADVPADEA